MLVTDKSPHEIKPDGNRVNLAKSGFLCSMVFAVIGLGMGFFSSYSVAAVISLLLAFAVTFSSVPYFIETLRLEKQRLAVARSVDRKISYEAVKVIIRFVFLQIGILALAIAVIFGIGYGIDEIGPEITMIVGLGFTFCGLGLIYLATANTRRTRKRGVLRGK